MDSRLTRSRFVALALGALAIGLAVHWRGERLTPAVRDVLGDALWAAMVAWWIGALLPRLPVLRRLVLALTFSFIVECSQLFHSPAIDALRETAAGQLTLGSGFDPRDFVSYAGGVLAALLIERAVLIVQPAARREPFVRRVLLDPPIPAQSVGEVKAR